MLIWNKQRPWVCCMWCIFSLIYLQIDYIFVKMYVQFHNLTKIKVIIKAFCLSFAFFFFHFLVCYSFLNSKNELWGIKNAVFWKQNLQWISMGRPLNEIWKIGKMYPWHSLQNWIKQEFFFCMNFNFFVYLKTDWILHWLLLSSVLF